jgi:hypothetical protein
MLRLHDWYHLTTEDRKIRRINVDSSTRDIVRKAYEFALNHVGQDKDSGEIWSDYIQFLRSGEVCYDRPKFFPRNPELDFCVMFLLLDLEFIMLRHSHYPLE